MKKVLKILMWLILFALLEMFYTVINFWLINQWLDFPPGEIKCSSQPGALFLRISFFETPLVIAVTLLLFGWLYVMFHKKRYLYGHMPVTLVIAALYATARIVSLGI